MVTFETQVWKYTLLAIWFIFLFQIINYFSVKKNKIKKPIALGTSIIDSSIHIKQFK